MPAPEREMLAGELAALLLTVTLPVAVRLAEGANVDVSVVVCPGAKVMPLAPVVLKPAPATITCAIVTLEFPASVIVTVWVVLLPTFTLPKFKLLTLELSNSVAALEVVVRKSGRMPSSDQLAHRLRGDGRSHRRVAQSNVAEGAAAWSGQRVGIAER